MYAHTCNMHVYVFAYFDIHSRFAWRALSQSKSGLTFWNPSNQRYIHKCLEHYRHIIHIYVCNADLLDFRMSVVNIPDSHVCIYVYIWIKIDICVHVYMYVCIYIYVYATYFLTVDILRGIPVVVTATHCNIYWYYCNTLQHTAMRCNIHANVYWVVDITRGILVTCPDTISLQHTATHCNVLQHICKCILGCRYHGRYSSDVSTQYHCNALQHTAARCKRSTLQHTCKCILAADITGGVPVTHIDTMSLQQTAAHAGHSRRLCMQCWFLGFQNVCRLEYTHTGCYHHNMQISRRQWNIAFWKSRDSYSLKITKNVIDVYIHRYVHLRVHIQGAELTPRYSLQHTATDNISATHCNALQHTATHWCTCICRVQTLRRGMYCNILQRRIWLQHTATHCNTLQHRDTRVYIGYGSCAAAFSATQKHSHCNTLQHTATHICTCIHRLQILRCAIPCNKAVPFPATKLCHSLQQYIMSLQHIATHICTCIIGCESDARHSLQYSATHNFTSTHCNTYMHTFIFAADQMCRIPCKTLQHIILLQLTATRCYTHAHIYNKVWIWHAAFPATNCNT